MQCCTLYEQPHQQRTLTLDAAGQPNLSAEFCDAQSLPVVVQQQQQPEQQPELVAQQQQQQQPELHPSQQQHWQQQHQQQTPAVSNGTAALHAMSIDGAEGASPTPAGGRQVLFDPTLVDVRIDATKVFLLLNSLFLFCWHGASPSCSVEPWHGFLCLTCANESTASLM
jgi:hypothetical protein